MRDAESWLQELQRGRESPLEDDGFSDRVAEQLSQERLAMRARRVAMSAAAAIGGALTVWLAPPIDSLALPDLDHRMPAVSIAFLAALVAMTAWAFAAAEFRDISRD